MCQSRPRRNQPGQDEGPRPFDVSREVLLVDTDRPDPDPVPGTLPTRVTPVETGRTETQGGRVDSTPMSEEPPRHMNLGLSVSVPSFPVQRGKGDVPEACPTPVTEREGW